jgi:hypothetical protein
MIPNFTVICISETTCIELNVKIIKKMQSVNRLRTALLHLFFLKKSPL